MRPLYGITNSMEKSLSKLWEIGKDRETLWTGIAAVHRVEKIQIQIRCRTTKVQTRSNWGKEKSLLTSGVGRNTDIYCKRMKPSTKITLHHIQKLTQNELT